MPVVARLQANSPIFAPDLQQLGQVFFPGGELAIDLPDAPADAAASAAASGPAWQVTVTALPADAGPDEMPGTAAEPRPIRWRVRVEAAAPDGRREAQEEMVAGQPDWSPRQYDHRLRRAARRLMLAVLGGLTGIAPGWGILTGVRPTKLVHDLLDRGLPMEEVRRYLAEEYRVRPDKIDLVTEVAARQRPFLRHGAGDPERYDPRAISVYIGIPYCPTICSFCSFSIYPLQEHRGELPHFLAALHRELEIIGAAVAELGLRIESLYLGGGTPTSPPDRDFAGLLEQIDRALLRGQRPREYTVEGGRPETFNRFKLDAMAAHGVTRVSVNPQTTVQATLRHLGRIHTVEKFYRAYDLVRRHPHPFVVNCDIIIGLPGEGPAEVAQTLADMRRLAPDNLTVHTLAVKRGSRLHGEGAGPEVLRRLTPQEAEALVAEAAATARSLGQHPYYLYRQKYMVGSLENVGYARPGTESIYNIQMMERRQTVIGLGAGATSAWFYAPANWLLKAPENPSHPGTYIARVEELAWQKVQHLRLLFGGETPAPAPRPPVGTETGF
ncbi:MAG: coproporphyrinogen dehydrogenase HemZ [Firmicutes bacterium]|nr:coproporphyrinogen dehydrogenase HemZ [Bacillota bacterium]